MNCRAAAVSPYKWDTSGDLDDTRMLDPGPDSSTRCASVSWQGVRVKASDVVASPPNLHELQGLRENRGGQGVVLLSIAGATQSSPCALPFRNDLQ
jgi:hypothetical protein